MIPKLNSSHGSETRNIINALIEQFNSMGYTYDQAMKMAQDILDEAERVNKENVGTQKQVDDLILHAGQSDAEVIQARGGLPLLKDRLDESDAMSQTFLSFFKPGIINLPEEFNELKPPLLKRNPFGNISYQYDIQDLYEVKGKTYYVDRTGDNSNDGLSRDSPLRTLTYALSKDDVGEVVLPDGLYGYSSSLSNGFSKDVKIKSEGRSIIGPIVQPDFEEYEGVYRLNTNQDIDRVFEMTDNEKFSELVEGGSLEEVKLNKNSWLIEGGTLYVNTNNPNEVFPTFPSNGVGVRGGSVFLENIDVYFSGRNADIRDGLLLAKNCNFRHSSGHNLLSRDSKVYLQSCEVTDGALNGVRYERSDVVEVDTIIKGNGSDNSSENLIGRRMSTSNVLSVDSFCYKNKGELNRVDGSNLYLLSSSSYESSAIDLFDIALNVITGNVWVDGSYLEGLISIKNNDGSVYVNRSILEGEVDGEVNVNDSITDIKKNNDNNNSDIQITQYRPTSNFDIRIEESGANYPRVLSADGNTVWGSRGRNLIKSDDEGANYEDIYQFDVNIGAVHLLDNGEVLVALNNIPNERNSEIYVSKENVTSFDKVLETSYHRNTFAQPFGGISIHENIVVCAEYGSKTPPNNARKVFLSTDYGASFEEITDFGTDEGRHIHGIAYDKWYERIWVVNGDGSHQGIRFSDDWGKSWHLVSDDLQPVGVIATENSVLFTMDGTPNGVMYWRRTNKNDINLSLDVGYHLDPELSGTLYAGQTHTVGRDGVVYMPFMHTVEGKSYILATKDGVNIYKLYETEVLDGWRGIVSIFGPTATGKAIGLYNIAQGDGHYGVLKADDVPSWEIF